MGCAPLKIYVINELMLLSLDRVELNRANNYSHPCDLILMIKTILFTLLMLSLVNCAGTTTVKVWQMDSAAKLQLRNVVDRRFNTLYQDGQLKEHVTSRDVAALALDAIASDYAPERSSLVLKTLRAMQDSAASSKTYGNFRWEQSDSEVTDGNAVEFVTRHAALIWLLYANQLTSAQKEPLLALLKTARIGVLDSRVPIAYTNIFLMKTWNLIALGEGLRDNALAKQGYDMLHDWLIYTARTGINEYLSPNYYPQDLESLALIANLSRDLLAQQMAHDGLDYFWQDIAMNWYRPANRLAGVHSRDYNRLFNTGEINRWADRAGWINGNVVPAATDPYQSLAWAPPPTAATRWLQAPLPRTVVARWGEEPEQRYTHYLSNNFSISSAETGYPSGHDNTPLVINLGAGQQVPIIDFFMDGRRDYYGKNKTLEAGSGHMKALHLRPFLTSVQNGNEVLFAASIRDIAANNVALESVITLPADAQYWLDDTQLDIFNESSKWQYDSMPNQRTTSITVEERGGKSQQVVLTDSDEKLGVGISRRFPVQAGAHYRISAALQGGDVYLYLNFYDAEGVLIDGEHTLKVSGGTDAPISREFIQNAPAAAVTCKAWLYSPSRNVTAIRISDLRFDIIETNGARMLGGFDFHVFKPQVISMAAGKTLFVRRGDAVAALRLLGAWDINAGPIPFVLHNDGLAYGALRLTATHANEHSERRASIAVWAQASDGINSDAQFAAYRQHVIAKQGNATLKGNTLEATQGKLRIVSDVGTGSRLVREGMQPAPTQSALWVDGRDVGRDLLGKYLQQP